MYNGYINTTNQLTEETKMKKTFAKRDSATAALRKLGVAKEDYNNFIEVVEAPHGKFFNVDLNAAKESLGTKVTLPKDYIDSLPKTTLKSAPAKTAPAAINGNGKITVSSFIRSLIQAGKTNAEIWAEVQPKFNLADSKKNYPAWYRSEMNRKGA